MGPVPLVLDLLITHDRFGSNSDPTINGTLHYPNPNDIDRSLNETGTDKIRKYHSDYNNNPPKDISFMPVFLVPQVNYIVNLLDFYSYRLIGKLTTFLKLQEFTPTLIYTSYLQISLYRFIINNKKDRPIVILSLLDQK